MQRVLCHRVARDGSWHNGTCVLERPLQLNSNSHRVQFHIFAREKEREREERERGREGQRSRANGTRLGIVMKFVESKKRCNKQSNRINYIGLVVGDTV